MAVNINTEYLIDEFVELRKRKKMSQAMVAKKADLHQAAVGRIESKNITPQIDTMIKLLNTMGYTLAIMPADGNYTRPVFIDIMNEIDHLNEANIQKIKDYIRQLEEEDMTERQNAIDRIMELRKDISIDPGESGTYKEILLEEQDRKYRHESPDDAQLHS